MKRLSQGCIVSFFPPNSISLRIVWSIGLGTYYCPPPQNLWSRRVWTWLEIYVPQKLPSEMDAFGTRATLENHKLTFTSHQQQWTAVNVT